MRIKTFLAKNMAEAMKQIKLDLGAEALILDTKEVPCRSGLGRSSSVEVVAAIDDGVSQTDGDDRVEIGRYRGRPARSRRVAEETVEAASGTYSPSSLLRQMASVELDADTATRKKGRARSRKRAVAEPESQERDALVEEVHSELVMQGVEESLACKLLQSVQEQYPVKKWRNRAALVKALRQVVEGVVENRADALSVEGRKVVMFFGPTGVGKTTALAKLAARLALTEKRKVALMTVDAMRIGAVDQLRTYASLMGVPFRFVSDLEELGQALEEQSQRDVVLIDTGGINPRDRESIQKLASFLRETTPIERHLVLSATTGSADTRSIVEHFESCAPDYLLFTKLDEAAAPGGVLNELVRSGKAPSFYTDGQRVPQDLHDIAGDGILDLVLAPNREGEVPCEIR